MLKKATSQRESVGLTLYQTQQQLARLQAHLDEAQETFSQTHKLREDVEASLERLKNRHKTDMGALREQEENRECADKLVSLSYVSFS